MNHLTLPKLVIRPCLALGLALGIWLVIPASSA